MIGFFTDKGNVRELNEDYLAYIIQDDFSLFIVADGMGGHNAGEIASKEAVEGMVEYIKENYGIIPLENILKEAVKYVNEKIYLMSLKRQGLSGMGTTITAILKNESNIYIANVGDSSCFGINNLEIKKITKDHSLVQELIDTGCITEEEARLHPRKNIITRAVGTNKNIEVDIFTIPSDKYEVFFLCTDGLTNLIENNEIWQEIINSKDFNCSCKKLIDIVKSRGERDNITALVCGGENKYAR